jgi:hypothetical protein
LHDFIFLCLDATHEQAGAGNNTQAFVGHVLQWLFLWQIPPDAMRWVLDSVCKHPAGQAWTEGSKPPLFDLL